MPQVYGKKKTVRTDISRIFADSPSPKKPTGIRVPTQDAAAASSRSQYDGESGTNLLVNKLGALSISESDDVFTSSTRTSGVRRRETASERLPLNDFDSNVRRSPRIAQRSTKSKQTSTQCSSPCNQRKSSREGDCDPGCSPLAPRRKSTLPTTPSKPSASPTLQPRTSSTLINQQESFCEPLNRQQDSSDKVSEGVRYLQTYVQPLLQLCNDVDGRTAPSSFQDWANKIDQYLTVSKIAEASYGEVYRLSLRDPTPGFDTADESVLKIIALKPGPTVEEKLSTAQSRRIKDMSEVQDVAGEVRLLRRMSPVPGFANFRECRVMQGPLPTQFVSAWRGFNKNVKKSEFPDPGKKGSYHEEQLWAVVEMQDAGRDLEDKPISSVWHVWDIFWGAAVALAKGEEWAEFEHRDLHLGNICVKWRDQDNAFNPPRRIDASRKFGTTCSEITLIDYTLSRANMQPGAEADCAFLDLNKDPDLFEGDPDVDYQYDIYRYMRSAVLCNDPNAGHQTQPKRRTKQPRGREKDSPWRLHHPLTNLVWLHFVLYKLTEQLLEWPSSVPAKRRRKMAKAEHEAAEAAEALEERIQHLWEILDLEHMKEWWVDEDTASATGLVAWAVGEGWLNQEDVLGLPRPKSDTESWEELTEEVDQPCLESDGSREDNDHGVQLGGRASQRRRKL